jgi:phosphatidylinositol glycan class B
MMNRIDTLHFPNRYTNIILALAIATQIAAVFMLVGWFSYDEHYQILEFANYKRGLLDPKYLPWEFQQQIRPTIQPALAYLLLGAFQVLGITDPYDQAVLFRMISALLFLICTLRLYSTLQTEFARTTYRNIYLFLSFFLYIIPVTSVRFSSENWSACYAMYAVAVLYPYIKQNTCKPITFRAVFIAGVLFGISFLFRYQSALIVAGLAVWLLLFRFSQLRYWLFMAAGFMAVGACGICIDRWFYGTWTITAWNYFSVNLLQGKAASFGIEPWWWYLKYMMDGRSMILLNGSLLVAVLIFGCRKFNHPFTWLFFPFLFFHFLIGHKEIRFLYPILVFVPFMLTDSLQFVTRWFRTKKLKLALIAPVLLINCIAFFASTLRAADNSSEIFKYLRRFENKPILVYYSGDEFFYTLSNSDRALAPRFYRQRLMVSSCKKGPNFVGSLKRSVKTSDTLVFAILNHDEQVQAGKKLRVVFDPLPEFIQTINHRNWLRLPLTDWKLYSLGKYKPAQSLR